MQGIDKVRKIMADQKINVLILVNPSNVKYVNSFDVPFWPAWMGDVSNQLPMVTAVVTESDTCLVASDLYATKIARAGISNAEIYQSFTHLKENNPELNYSKALKKVLQNLCGTVKSPIIGVEPNCAVKYMLDIVGEELPNCTFADAEMVMKRARYIKTIDDIKGLKEAARVADAAQERLYEISKNEGIFTELDIWFEVQKAASKAAGRLTPFVGELVTGPRTGLSDYPLGPENRIVEKGDIAIMDISPRVNGYWGDCSNSVVFWTEPNEEQKRYFHAVLEAFEVGREAIKPGVKFSEVNRKMEESYRKNGMIFCSYQGHQIGCSVNEEPRFTYVDQSIIEENMVVCIEPQMYTGKAGKTGVRLERMLHVTSQGAQALNQFPWGL